MMRPMRPSLGLRVVLRGLGRRRPRTRGSVRVDGLHAQVIVNRDRWGIPHVEAQTNLDAWFGLGFCHGQDRGFQLELLARAGRGRVSELVGAAGLPIDRLSRTLGFGRLATAQRPLLAPDVEATITAYVAGINAATAVTPRPHELVALRSRPSSWTVEDVLAFLGLQSLALGANWDTELARLRILQSDGPDALRAVEPRFGDWLPVVTPVGAAFGPAPDHLAGDLGLLTAIVGGSGGSNAWAVAGDRTVSGAPILANDPHLGPSIPAPWYLAHLTTPEWAVAGASFVGGPAFPSGHNGRVAWGVTAACTDGADLFREELDPSGARARGPDGPEPVARFREEIEVRGAASVVEEVLVTARGPIVSPVLDGVEDPLSLSAVWLRPAPVRGLLDVVRATDFESFRRGFAEWSGPTLNVVYADAGGHIGWQLVGNLPRRRGSHGTLPQAAWEGGWEADTVPFDSMPRAIDPPEGFIASANNAARSDLPDAPFLGVDWLDGYRAARIVEVLGSRADWDVAATAALQVDMACAPWRDLREHVLAVPTDDEAARRAQTLLAGWDGILDAGSVGASVYELFVSELAALLARGAAPASWEWAIGRGFGETVTRTSFGARTVSHVVAVLRAEPHEAEITAALAGAVTTLRQRFGTDPAGWAWGTVRPLRLRHALGARPPLAGLGVGPVAWGGDANTVAQAGVQPLDPLANPAAIANHRMVVDLGDPDASRYVLAGGQSGNPLSPHYADLFELWQRGEGVPIAWTHQAVVAATVDTLFLRPGSLG
jgi:penicillin amidase